MGDVITLIDHICARPGVYIGQANLDRLFVFLQGYWHGLSARGNDNADDEIMGEFEDFIQRRYGTSRLAD